MGFGPCVYQCRPRKRRNFELRFVPMRGGLCVFSYWVSRRLAPLHSYVYFPGAWADTDIYPSLLLPLLLFSEQLELPLLLLLCTIFVFSFCRSILCQYCSGSTPSVLYTSIIPAVVSLNQISYNILLCDSPAGYRRWDHDA